MELKTILAIVLCLVIVGGAVFCTSDAGISERSMAGGLNKALPCHDRFTFSDFSFII